MSKLPKFIHTADWHLGATSYIPDNVERQIRTIKWIFKTAKKHKVDALLVCGDVFDRHQAPSVLKDRFLKLILKLENYVDFPVLVIEGNHSPSDKYVNLDTYAMLEKKGKLSNFFFATTAPRFLTFKKFQALLIPYGVPVKETLAKYRKKAKEKPTVALIHQDFAGAVVGYTKTGKERKLKGEKFPCFSEYWYYALGDIHKMGPVPGCAKAWYSGSPIQHNVGESLPKGVLLVVNPLSPKLIKVPRKVAKPIVKVKEGEPIPEDAYVIYEGEASGSLPENVIDVIPGKVSASLSTYEKVHPFEMTKDLVLKAAKEELEESNLSEEEIKERLEVLGQLMEKLF